MASYFIPEFLKRYRVDLSFDACKRTFECTLCVPGSEEWLAYLGTGAFFLKDKAGYHRVQQHLILALGLQNPSNPLSLFSMATDHLLRASHCMSARWRNSAGP